MKKQEYIDLHRLLAKLKYEIALELTQTNNEDIVIEYQEAMKSIDNIMKIFIIEGE